MRQVLRVDEPRHCLVERNARGHEDGQDDEEPGKPLAARAAQVERNSERNSRERVAEVMNQIGKQGDTVRRHEDESLRRSRNPEHRKTDRNRPDPVARSNDRTVDEAMRMAVTMSRIGVMAMRAVAMIVVVLVTVVSMTMIRGKREGLCQSDADFVPCTTNPATGSPASRRSSADAISGRRLAAFNTPSTCSRA